MPVNADVIFLCRNTNDIGQGTTLSDVISSRVHITNVLIDAHVVPLAYYPYHSSFHMKDSYIPWL